MNCYLDLLLNILAPSLDGLGIGTGLMVVYERFDRRFKPRQLTWVVMDSKDKSDDPVDPIDAATQLKKHKCKPYYKITPFNTLRKLLYDDSVISVNLHATSFSSLIILFLRYCPYFKVCFDWINVWTNVFCAGVLRLTDS